MSNAVYDVSVATAPIVTINQLSACLSVADLDAAAEWYRQTLGFEVVLQQDFPALGARVAYLDVNGARLELVEDRQYTPAPRPEPPHHTALQGVSQLSFWVEDLALVAEQLAGHAVPIVFGPVTVDELGLKALFVRDNEGNLIEFLQALVAEIAAPVAPLDTAQAQVVPVAASGIQRSTYEVATQWFSALTSGDIATALSCLADDVEWLNYTVVPGLNDLMPWIGTYHGPQQVFESFKVFTSVVEVKHEELVRMIVQGNEVAGVIAEHSTVRATGVDFTIEFIQWLTIEHGKIVRWKSYTDPSPIIAAMRGIDPAGAPRTS